MAGTGGKLRGSGIFVERVTQKHHLSPSGAASCWQREAMPLLRSLSLLRGGRVTTKMPLLRSWSGQFVWLRAKQPTRGCKVTDSEKMVPGLLDPRLPAQFVGSLREEILALR